MGQALTGAINKAAQIVAVRELVRELTVFIPRLNFFVRDRAVKNCDSLKIYIIKKVEGKVIKLWKSSQAPSLPEGLKTAPALKLISNYLFFCESWHICGSGNKR